MKRSVLFAAAFFLLLSSCRFSSNRVETGNHKKGVVERELQPFNRVSLNGSMDLYVEEGDNFIVRVEGEQNMLELVETQVSDGLLQVDFRDNTNLLLHERIRVFVTAPAYSSFQLLGSGDLYSVGEITHPDRLIMELSGSGNLNIAVDAPAVDIVSNGSGKVKLWGMTRDLNLLLRGSGDADTESLKAENVTIHSAGSGGAAVYASMKLDVDLKGSGDISYRGNPEVSSRVMGSGRVEKSTSEEKE